MAYNNSIPQPPDQLSQSQSQILDNFAYLQTYLQVNHGSINDMVNGGKHNFIEFPVQAMMPTFAPGETGMYNFLNSTTSQNEIYAHIQTAGMTSTFEIPFTASVLGTNAANLITTGWTYLPSGLLIKWGRIPPGTLNINAGGAFGPNYSAKIYAVFGNNSVNVQTFSLVITTQPPAGAVLTLTASGGFAVDWLTIGV